MANNIDLGVLSKDNTLPKLLGFSQNRIGFVEASFLQSFEIVHLTDTNNPNIVPNGIYILDRTDKTYNINMHQLHEQAIVFSTQDTINFKIGSNTQTYNNAKNKMLLISPDSYGLSITQLFAIQSLSDDDVKKAKSGGFIKTDQSDLFVLKDNFNPQTIVRKTDIEGVPKKNVDDKALSLGGGFNLFHIYEIYNNASAGFYQTLLANFTYHLNIRDDYSGGSTIFIPDGSGNQTIHIYFGEFSKDTTKYWSFQTGTKIKKNGTNINRFDKANFGGKFIKLQWTGTAWSVLVIFDTTQNFDISKLQDKSIDANFKTLKVADRKVLDTGDFSTSIQVGDDDVVASKTIQEYLKPVVVVGSNVRQTLAPNKKYILNIDNVGGSAQIKLTGTSGSFYIIKFNNWVDQSTPWDISTEPLHTLAVSSASYDRFHGHTYFISLDKLAWSMERIDNERYDLGTIKAYAESKIETARSTSTYRPLTANRKYFLRIDNNTTKDGLLKLPSTGDWVLVTMGYWYQKADGTSFNWKIKNVNGDNIIYTYTRNNEYGSTFLYIRKNNVWVSELVSRIDAHQIDLNKKALTLINDGVQASYNSLKKIYNLIIGRKGTEKTFDTIALRNSGTASVQPGQWVRVKDASADANVKSGWAIYEKQADGTWFMIQEQESVNIELTHIEADIRNNNTSIRTLSTALGFINGGTNNTNNSLQKLYNLILTRVEKSFGTSDFNPTTTDHRKWLNQVGAKAIYTAVLNSQSHHQDFKEEPYFNWIYDVSGIGTVWTKQGKNIWSTLWQFVPSGDLTKDKGFYFKNFHDGFKNGNNYYYAEIFLYFKVSDIDGFLLASDGKSIELKKGTSTKVKFDFKDQNNAKMITGVNNPVKGHTYDDTYIVRILFAKTLNHHGFKTTEIKLVVSATPAIAFGPGIHPIAVSMRQYKYDSSFKPLNYKLHGKTQEFDTAITQNSTNAVESSAIYRALQDKLTAGGLNNVPGKMSLIYGSETTDPNTQKGKVYYLQGSNKFSDFDILVGIGKWSGETQDTAHWGWVNGIISSKIFKKNTRRENGWSITSQVEVIALSYESDTSFYVNNQYNSKLLAIYGIKFGYGTANEASLKLEQLRESLTDVYWRMGSYDQSETIAISPLNNRKVGIASSSMTLPRLLDWHGKEIGTASQGFSGNTSGSFNINKLILPENQALTIYKLKYKIPTMAAQTFIFVGRFLSSANRTFFGHTIDNPFSYSGNDFFNTTSEFKSGGYFDGSNDIVFNGGFITAAALRNKTITPYRDKSFILIVTTKDVSTSQNINQLWGEGSTNTNNAHLEVAFQLVSTARCTSSEIMRISDRLNSFFKIY